MKKLTLAPALLAGVMTLASCGTGSSQLGNGALLGALTGTSGLLGTSSSSSAAATTGSVLTSLLGNLLGQSSTLSQQDLIGTWTYQGSDCVFESENLLLKVGGEVAAAKVKASVNEQLTKVGIKAGSSKFTFNQDGTYTATIGARTINGQYTLNPNNKTITMTYLAGLAKMTPKVTKTGNNLSLLFESDKLLTLLKGASALTSNTNLATVSSLLQQYDGLYVGLQLKK